MSDTTEIHLPAEGLTIELTDAGRRALLVVHRADVGSPAVPGTSTDAEARTVNEKAVERLLEQGLVLEVTHHPTAELLGYVISDLGDRVIPHLYGDPAGKGEIS